jgi:hypothetical protein
LLDAADIGFPFGSWPQGSRVRQDRLQKLQRNDLLPSYSIGSIEVMRHSAGLSNGSDNYRKKYIQKRIWFDSFDIDG